MAPRFLVVDDNEDNRFTLALLLEAEGYTEVALAENGQDAIECLAQQSVDVVLLDIMMPVLDGYNTLERIKTDMNLRDIPVIMISAIDETDSVVRCLELGAEDYLTKPFNAAVLKARVNACLMQKRLHDQEAGYLRQIEQEKRRAEQLLHATLPAAAVHELKSTNAVKPRRFEDVTVLFCDVVKFTAYCDQHSPEEVVGHLQNLVNAFEDIASAHGLEKIKTIGDAFMATAGLLQHVPRPAIASVRAGLEMIDAAKRLPPGWSVRIGIHGGPLVGGVIGRTHYSFDVWGDTVNTAARIVDQAAPDTVLMSSRVWRDLDGSFQGRSKGLVELKGKGQLELIECAALDGTR